ncbi:MAG: L-seryl-tRNA(Sec) selenium transferase [Actinomycetota bacterium]
MKSEPVRPPSVDSVARELSESFSLPHAILVDCARRAIADDPAHASDTARRYAQVFADAMLVDVVNATGVLLHTNLGRAPLPDLSIGRASNLEFDMTTGQRGSRHSAIAQLISVLTGAEDAIVVNNNAAAVMLVLAALAHDRDVAVSRGESVEIGGGFRIPEVMEQSGARLVDVGTTNRTRLSDYEKAINSKRHDVALVMKIHPSNFAIEGFTQDVSISELATCSVPVVADIGSGLIDNTCPWLHGVTPQIPHWLVNEPAAKQAISDGAALVTFSGDKILGGPQCGIIAGKKDLVEKCARHPFMRALRPGGHTILALQETLMSYCARTACEDIPFWFMVSQSADAIRERADAIVRDTHMGRVIALDSLVGAGSAPGTTLPSYGIACPGDVRQRLRSHSIPVIARTIDDTTYLDLRSVHPNDDVVIRDALVSLGQ